MSSPNSKNGGTQKAEEREAKNEKEGTVVQGTAQQMGMREHADSSPAAPPKQQPGHREDRSHDAEKQIKDIKEHDRKGKQVDSAEDGTAKDALDVQEEKGTLNATKPYKAKL